MSEQKKETQVIGTSDMPTPPVIDYSTMYKVTPLFRNDLMRVIGNMAYCDVKKITNILDEHKNIMGSADLNDFINTLSNLPYRVIHPLMKIIEGPDNFSKYFEPIKNKV